MVESGSNDSIWMLRMGRESWTDSWILEAAVDMDESLRLRVRGELPWAE